MNGGSINYFVWKNSSKYTQVCHLTLIQLIVMIDWSAVWTVINWQIDIKHEKELGLHWRRDLIISCLL